MVLIPLDTGARNERRFAAVNYNKTPGFEVIHGLLDRVMLVLEVKFDPARGYSLKAAEGMNKIIKIG